MTRELVSEAVVKLENALIGAVLVRPEMFDQLPLNSSHFASFHARATWDAICNVVAKGQRVDVATVDAELDAGGKYEAVGAAYLGTCILDVPSPDAMMDYASQIREQSLHRACMLVLGNAIHDGKTGRSSGKELLGEVLAALGRLDAEDVRDETSSIRDLVKAHIKYLEQMAAKRMNGAIELTGVPTGIAGLDAHIGGWQFGIVSVACARPKHGKSSLMLATADEATARGYGVHVFSLEDPRRMYLNRTLARVAQISTDAFATCVFSKGDLENFSAAQRKLTAKSRPWLVDDRSGICASDIVRTARRHRKENGTRAVIVDYLQLLKREPNSISHSRHEQIGESLNILADAAKNDDMAYVVCSQLNRGVEGRPDKRPVESDLRESGTIEERAKCIVGIYRGSAYGPDPQDDVDVDDNGELMSQDRFKRTVQLLVLKNSQGASPLRVLAKWTGETTRME